MTKEQLQIQVFSQMAQQHCPVRPEMPNILVRMLRVRLIAEELQELAFAYGLTLDMKANGTIEIKQPDGYVTRLIDAYDAVLDLKYVVEGTGVAMGLDLEPGFQEVHKSNMTKFVDGFRDTNGKWRKGPSYKAPDLVKIIEAQMI